MVTENNLGSLKPPTSSREALFFLYWLQAAALGNRSLPQSSQFHPGPVLAGSVWPKNGSKVRECAPLGAEMHPPPRGAEILALGAEIPTRGAGILPLGAEIFPWVKKCLPSLFFFLKQTIIKTKIK